MLRNCLHYIAEATGGRCCLAQCEHQFGLVPITVCYRPVMQGCLDWERPNHDLWVLGAPQILRPLMPAEPEF